MAELTVNLKAVSNMQEEEENMIIIISSSELPVGLFVFSTTTIIFLLLHADDSLCACVFSPVSFVNFLSSFLSIFHPLFFFLSLVFSNRIISACFFRIFQNNKIALN